MAYKKTVISIFSLLLIVCIIIAIQNFKTPFQTIHTFTTDPVVEARKVFHKYFSSKDSFTATFGPLISQEKCERLQFSIKRYVVFFRIVRYFGQDKEFHDYSQYYKLESDKKTIKELNPYLNQYCEWEAKGALAFSFYIDMSTIDKWEYKWDEKSFTLTLYPPDIKANTPAELEPYKYHCIADSVSIDEDATKKSLETEIIRLKQKLAEDQKRFMYPEAKEAIIKHYQKFFFIINKGKTPTPHINVIFRKK